MRARLIHTLAITLVLAASGCGGGAGSPGAAPAPSANTVSPAAGWSWQQVSSLSVQFTGSLLANAVLDSPAEGAKLLVFSGPTGRNAPSPFEVIKITTSGTLQDATGTSFVGGVAGAVHARRMVAGDLNGDGIPDLFSANHGFDQPPFPGEHNSLFLSAGAGVFTDSSATLPQLRMYTHSAAIGDLRKSGSLDILVGGLGMTQNPGLASVYQGPNTAGTNNDFVGPYILRGDGRGHLVYDNLSLPAKVANNFIADASAPGRFTSSLFADVNADGYPDLVLGSEQNSAAAGSVYLNDGQGRFDTSEHLLPPGLFGKQNTIVLDIASLDVNGDAQPDLLLNETQNAPIFYGVGKIQVLINRGGGVFEDQTATFLPGQLPNAHWAQFLNFVDVEGTGCQSIVQQINFPEASDVQAYTCDGRGAYKPVPASQLPGAARSLRPVTVGGKVYLLSVATNGSTATVTLHQRK